MKMKTIGTVLASATCLIAATVAVADNPMSVCDVVTLSGSGTRLETGVTAGSSTMTIVATGEQIPVAFSEETANSTGTSFQRGPLVML